MKKSLKNVLLVSLLFTGVIACNEVATSQTSTSGTSTSDTSTSETTTSEVANELTIEDLFVYKNYKMRPYITFTKEKEDITYSFEGDAISIDDDGVITCNKEDKIVKVSATTEHLSTTFTVYTRGNFTDYQAKVQNRKVDFVTRGEQYGETLFIGDSFFDVAEFWNNFYDLYAGKNVRSAGISASTTTDWEIFAEDLIYPSEPKNIVIHCGTNNIFDDGKNANSTFYDVKRLIEKIHYVLEDTKIYYFGIEPRTYGAKGNSVSNTVVTLNQANKLIKEFCDNNAYLTYLDSPALCYNEDGSVKTEFFRDGTHPVLDNYAYYVDLLDEAGIVLEDKQVSSKIADFSTSVANSIGDSSRNISYKGTNLNREFSLEGTLKIKQTGGNPHIQFSLDNTSFANRFLLWDNLTNGNFKIGYAINSNHDANADAGSTYVKKAEDLVLNWKILVTSKNAYLYINGDLKIIMLNIPNDATKSFLMGAEHAAVDFYNMKAISKEFDANEYNALLNDTIVKKYEASQETTRQVIRDKDF